MTEQSSFDQNRQRQADAISNIAKNAPSVGPRRALAPNPSEPAITPDAAADTLPKAPLPQEQNSLDSAFKNWNPSPEGSIPNESET